MNDPKTGHFVPGTHWRATASFREKGYLEAEYLDKGRSLGDLAREHGVSEPAIRFWANRHGIQRRDVSAARRLKHWGVSGEKNPMHGKTGDQNPNYKDGSSPERQKDYAKGKGRAFLARILQRDRHKCRRCGSPSTGPRSLHVHHIKPWAGNPELRFLDDNAVTLCRGCHGWVHSRENTERDFRG